ncbi:hypothetical protein IEZ26_15855 [Nocardioides cavernae]|uniref:Uncharacterized protein n=1 Tax=Nocardioides cavernae TaxID=1921566 RepID=A0ABR8NGS9_9ACTN|nr:hypothetical protein [Nocardioides cavernae]MBD3926099.1 hypothetical protein [Nocardioides cavernae]MBM7513688.1 hypothetical protein [Nocardioides cavernae]
MSDGSRDDLRWYLHGKLHREDGPAIEYADGTLEWHRHDQLHRFDGPARDYAGGWRKWYVHGMHIPFPHTMILESLLGRTDYETLELVLSSWRPDGPNSSALLDAIRAARL